MLGRSSEEKLFSAETCADNPVSGIIARGKMFFGFIIFNNLSNQGCASKYKCIYFPLKIESFFFIKHVSLSFKKLSTLS